MSWSCLEVRERLAEFAVDALPAAEAREVERHLDWCPGCRKEAGEFQEGAARMAFALQAAPPPPALGSKVVDRVAVASGRHRPSSRRAIRVAAVAVLAAALLAAGSLTFALAMRGKVATLQQKVSQTTKDLNRFQELLQHLKANGKVFEANLVPSPGGAGGGTAAIVTAPNAADWVMVQVDVGPTSGGPYRVLLQQRSGVSILAGSLVRTANGPFVLSAEPRYFAADLSRLSSVVVLDHTGRPVLAGPVQPYTTG